MGVPPNHPFIYIDGFSLIDHPAINLGTQIKLWGFHQKSITSSVIPPRINQNHPGTSSNHGKWNFPINGGFMMGKSSLNRGIFQPAMFDYRRVTSFHNPFLGKWHVRIAHKRGLITQWILVEVFSGQKRFRPKSTLLHSLCIPNKSTSWQNA